MHQVADNVDQALLIKIFEAQRAHQFAIGVTTAKERIAKLKRLKTAVEVTYRAEIHEALRKDFGKPAPEVDMTEIYPVVSEIKHAISHLDSWMENKYVKTPLSLLGASSYIKYEPKGVCLILAPWNFPLNLMFGPLASAMAAGNTAVLKPSEFTPHISGLMKKIVQALFVENEVCLVEGGPETSKALLALPFNHIFFTGSTAVGKMVMAAAAKNLASVTLELGGKSPTIVDETANVSLAVKRIALAKCTNAGQVCIAPDYVLVHESKKEELVAAFRQTFKDFFGDNAETNPEFTRIVNERHVARLHGYLQEAALKGATILGGRTNIETSYVEPTLVTDVPADCALMQEEIFGPILPVISYSNLEEVIQLINGKEKPLALYIFSNSDKNINKIISETRAGGTCVNHNAIHFYNTNLPFGGSNASGIGKAHGFFGFESFSNARGVYRQHLPGAIDFLKPPFTSLKKKLVDLTVKYF